MRSVDEADVRISSNVIVPVADAFPVRRENVMVVVPLLNCGVPVTPGAYVVIRFEVLDALYEEPTNQIARSLSIRTPYDVPSTAPRV
jgi:hypothetical protein